MNRRKREPVRSYRVPTKDCGWKYDADMRVVSNGCKCEWRPRGGWDERKCPVHRKETA